MNRYRIVFIVLKLRIDRTGQFKMKKKEKKEEEKNMENSKNIANMFLRNGERRYIERVTLRK